MSFKIHLLYLTLAGLLASCSTNNKSNGEKNHFSDTISIRTEFDKYFKDCNVQGSIVIYDNTLNRWVVNDTSEIDTETLPASTFKIINLLIALETEIIKDENEIIKWKGKTDTTKYGYRPDIYHDMTAREAFEISAVWVFIELAKKIGKDNYKHYLKACNYGNQNISEQEDDFWNFGAFGISPINQVSFLRNFYNGDLPFSKKNIEIVKNVMTTEQTDNYTIKAKTGWTRDGGINTGWWVGYIETKQDVYFFATRLLQDRKLNSSNFGTCRKEITKSIFRDLNILTD